MDQKPAAPTGTETVTLHVLLPPTKHTQKAPPKPKA